MGPILVGIVGLVEEQREWDFRDCSGSESPRRRVRYDRPMRALILLLLCVACDAGAKPPPPPPAPEPVLVLADATVVSIPGAAEPEPERPLSADDRQVIAAMLARYRANRENLADYGLVGTKHYVLVEPGQHEVVLPAPYVSVTWQVLDQEADRTQQHIGFVRVFSVVVTGNTAQITTGGYTDLPAPERDQPRNCCCESTELYVRTRTGWRYSKTTSTICS